MNDYATLSNLETLWRPLLPNERERASELLSLVSSCLRMEARKVGKDLDVMIEVDPDLEQVAKSVTIDVVARSLMSSTHQEPMSQYSESVGGYTFSGSPLVAGGGLWIKRSELARLGLNRQRIGVIDFYGND